MLGLFLWPYSFKSSEYYLPKTVETKNTRPETKSTVKINPAITYVESDPWVNPFACYRCFVRQWQQLERSL